MGKGEKRIEEHKEHKSKEKEIVISPKDILKALKKLAEILPSSGPEELTILKSKIATEKQKIEQEIEKDVQKEKEIAQLVREIEGINEKIIHLPEKEKQDLRLSLQKTKPTRSDIQKMEAIIKKKQDEFHKELAKKQEELQTLRNPSFKPLQPTEMVDALIYSPYRPNSLDEVLVKLHGLTAGSSAQDLIDTTNSLISLARIELLKPQIDSRKDFLKTTKEKLPLLTKLPNKPGEEDSIGGFYKLWNQFSKFWGRSGDKELGDRANITDFILNMKNLQEAFFFDEQTNVNLRLDFSMKSIDVLIQLCLRLEHWGTSQFMSSMESIDLSEGIVAPLVPLLSKVNEIVKIVSLLVKDFTLLYDFVEPDKSSPQNLMLLLKNHRQFLYQQKESNHKKFLKAQDFYDLGFVREENGSVKRKGGITLQVERGELRKSDHEDFSEKNSDLLEQYKEDLEEIIISCFNESSLTRKPLLTRAISKYTDKS